MNRKTRPFGSGAVTPEKDNDRDAHHSAPIPNEDQPSHLPPLDDGPQRPLIGRIKTHPFILLVLQLLNDTVTLGTMVLIVLGVHKLVEILL